MKQVYAASTSLKHCFSWILLILAVFVTSCCDFSNHLARVVCQPESSLLIDNGLVCSAQPCICCRRKRVKLSHFPRA